MNEINEIRIKELYFNSSNNHLVFSIEKYTRKPKITRYVTSNYQRTPIYGDYSERTKVLMKFNKIINPIKFVNEQIKEIIKFKYEYFINVNYYQKEIIIKIIDEIGIMPLWRQQEIDLDDKDDEINQTRKSLRNFAAERYHFQFKPTNFVEKPSNFWLCLIMSFFSFGLSFVNYVTKKQAKQNIIENQNNLLWNESHQVEINQKNDALELEINDFNENKIKELNLLEEEYQTIKNRDIYSYEKIIDDKWLDLNSAVHFSNNHLKNQKGVYIIWNETKDKHYVGQSKNLGQRIFSQHFNNGEVKNIIFAKDWYSGDKFKYKYLICETKDQLDELERNKIDLYNSFQFGYNSTKGNS